MNKILKRLVVFFIGIPALLSLLLLFPQKNHLVFNIVTIVFSVLGAVEWRNILSKKTPVISMPEAVVLGAISPAAWTLVMSFGVAESVVNGAFIAGAFLLLAARVFSGKEKLDSGIGKVTSGFAVMIYPGVFMARIIHLSAVRGAGAVILVFLLAVFLNDALAWVTGVLFGANNRGFIPVSPGKSVAGFAGGMAASVITGMAAVLIVPGVFASGVMPSPAAGALLGFGTGIAAILGDLGESALKRSAGVKDSGTLILGRGGALDSIDSLALAAPVYCLLFRLLF